MAFHVPERFRVATGSLRTTYADGNYGVFEMLNTKSEKLICIAADADTTGWQHVSCYVIYVSNGRPKRKIPSWSDMCYVKSVFWDDEDCVVQYHLPKSQYVNDNPYVLHLWRSALQEMPMPPKECV
jgi:hypothetical protein